MLTPNTIFKKTEAGVAEVSARALGLRAVLRRVLIMVDGRQTVATLASTVRGEEIDGLIYELQSLGLVDPTGGATAAQRNTASTTNVSTDATTNAIAREPGHSLNAPAGGEPTKEQLISAKLAAVRTLNDMLGPTAETFALRIEKCRTPNELREQVALIRQSLVKMIGEASGTRFVDAVRDGAKPS